MSGAPKPRSEYEGHTPDGIAECELCAALYRECCFCADRAELERRRYQDVMRAADGQSVFYREMATLARESIGVQKASVEAERDALREAVATLRSAVAALLTDDSELTRETARRVLRETQP